MAVVLLITVVPPGAVTLLVPTRWLPVWLGLLVLIGAWIWGQPIDGPGGVFAYFALFLISLLNGVIILGRVLKIAIDRDRKQ